jgi:hypothetical protein
LQQSLPIVSISRIPEVLEIFINMLFKNYPEGFVVNGEKLFEKGDGWNMARYVADVSSILSLLNQR